MTDGPWKKPRPGPDDAWILNPLGEWVRNPEYTGPPVLHPEIGDDGEILTETKPTPKPPSRALWFIIGLLVGALFF